jgi:hypothetical protein
MHHVNISRSEARFNQGAAVYKPPTNKFGGLETAAPWGEKVHAQDAGTANQYCGGEVRSEG